MYVCMYSIYVFHNLHPQTTPDPQTHTACQTLALLSGATCWNMFDHTNIHLLIKEKMKLQYLQAVDFFHWSLGERELLLLNKLLNVYVNIRTSISKFNKFLLQSILYLTTQESQKANIPFNPLKSLQL